MLPDVWSETTLRDVSLGIYDGPHATPPKTSEGPIFLGISSLSSGRIDLTRSEHLSESDFVTWTRRVCPQADDVVFSYETRLGEAALIPPGLRCCLGRRMALIRPDRQRIEPRYLLYYYLSPRFQGFIRSRTVQGSTVDRIHLEQVPGFPVVLPPIDEQGAIAGILGALDDKIELNRQMNRTLGALAAAIFKSWFVDFDPVVAKADGRAPFGMDAETAALFPSSFDDSALGPIPERWPVAALPDAFEVNPARRLPPDTQAPYLGMANMPADGHAPLSWTVRAAGSGMRFQNGDTLVARITPCLENGKTAFVDFLEDGEVGWGSTEYLILRPREPLPLVFAYCLARTDDFRAFAIQAMTGSSGRQRVQAAALRGYEFVSPQASVAGAFGAIVEPLFARAASNVRESRTLCELRDMLLPKLVSGEIRVVQAEKALAGV